MSHAGEDGGKAAKRPKGRRSRWVLIALIVSVGLNLVVAGMALRAAWTFHQFKGPLERIGPRGLKAYTRKLPEETRAKIRQHMLGFREESRPLREKIRMARRRVFEAMRAEPFDKQVLLTRNAEFNALRATLRDKRNAINVEVLAELTPEQRAEFIKWRRHRHFRRRGHHWRRDD